MSKVYARDLEPSKRTDAFFGEVVPRDSSNSQNTGIPGKNTTMYVSYAKDVFNEIWDRTKPETKKQMMTEAIELVKQAREAFE